MMSQSVLTPTISCRTSPWQNVYKTHKSYLHTVLQFKASNERVLAKLYDFDTITEIDMDCDARHVPELQEWVDRPGFHTFSKVSNIDDSYMPLYSIEDTSLTFLFCIHRVQSMPKLSSPAMLI